MAYKLRDRKQKRIYVSSSSSESDSSLSDPDYSRTRPRRQPQRNNNNPCAPKETTDVEMVEAGKSRRRRKRAPYSFKKSARPSANKTAGIQPKMRRTILSRLIEMEMIEENAEVWYMDETRRRILLKGMITRGGIFCHCCKKEITVWEFEVHAECDDLQRPYANIFLARKRVSLLECQLLGSQHYGFNKIEPKENAVDKNDDACMICADGGDLICCDNCPSTFHTDCMHMETIPQDDWLCPYCVCKHCGLAGYGADELFTCSQCQKKYHWACYLEEDLDLNTPVTPVNSFCGQSCREIYEHLERMLGVRNEVDGGLTWSLIRQTDLESAAPINNLHQIVECNCKIALVWGMLDQSFVTTIDRHTSINVIHSVIYNRGSNLNRINFNGFYTAILEKDDEIISAACLRIHGKKIAEMPFVATNENYRHKGMWRKLLAAIESVLCFLKVECLVIPSIEDLVTMWTEKYGFSRVEDAVMKDLISFNTLMFAKAVRLQKTLMKSECIDIEAMEVDEDENNENPNGVDPRQNQENQMVQSEMEVDEVEDDENQMVQNGRNLPLLDLNLEPPEEGEMLTLGMAWNRLT